MAQQANQRKNDVDCPMTSFTPEPWKKSHNGRDLELIVQERAGFNMVIAELKHPDIGSELANAARIVSCVNGCQGLNPVAYREVVEALRAIVPDFEALAYEPDNAMPQIRRDMIAEAKTALTHAEQL